jgi:hypothetical protein
MLPRRGSTRFIKKPTQAQGDFDLPKALTALPIRHGLLRHPDMPCEPALAEFQTLPQGPNLERQRGEFGRGSFLSTGHRAGIKAGRPRPQGKGRGRGCCRLSSSSAVQPASWALETM